MNHMLIFKNTKTRSRLNNECANGHSARKLSEKSAGKKLQLGN